MGKLQFRRGNKSVLPTGDSGEPLLATDSEELFVGTPNGNRGITLKGSTTDYTIYVATSTYGGVPSSSGATGKPLLTGTADAGTGGTTLYDAAGTFTSAAHLNKAIYNATTGVWSKVASVSSSTNLTLSVSGSFASGDTYIITNAFDNIPEAFNVADAGYNANITLRVSDGTFSSVLTLIGKTAGAAKTLTLQGSTTGTTTVSGETSIYQKISLKNITFTKRIFEYFGADVDWTTCVTSGDDGFLLLKSTSVANTFRTSSVIIIENDPAVYTSISSTVTKGYTIYVATSTYGGDDAVGDGLKITQGSATSTTANKLVDSTANFNSTDHLNKTLYNSTDDTWAQITAIDSTTQVSISADIMASGEAYVIANAVATIQKAIDLIPGTVNCNTTVKISDGTYSEIVTIQGKNLSGNYYIKTIGTMTLVDNGTSSGLNTNAYPITQTRFFDTAKAWSVSAHIGKILKLISGTGASQNYSYRIILDNAATYLDLVGLWDTTPDNTSIYKILSFATIVNSASTTGSIYNAPGQRGVIIQHISFTGTSMGGVWSEGSSVDIVGCQFLNANGSNSGIYYTAGATGDADINYVPSGGPGYGVRSVVSTIGASYNYLVSAASNAALFVEGSGGISVAEPYLKGNYLKGGAQGGLYLFAGASVTGMYNNWITGGSTYGIYINHNSMVRIVTNNLIENATSHGIFCNNGHVLFAASASTTNMKNNGGWGVYGQTTSTGQNMTIPTYTTNTSGTWSFAAGSYSYGS